MDNHVMARNAAFSASASLTSPRTTLKRGSAEMMSDVPIAARSEVVVDGHRGGGGRASKWSRNGCR